MDWKFWIAISISVAGPALTFWQIVLMKRQLGAERGMEQMPIKGRQYKQYWPVLALLVLMCGTWIPYLITRSGPPLVGLAYQITLGNGLKTAFTANQPITMNFFLVNSGPTAAQDLRSAVELIIEPSPVGPTKEDEIWNDFVVSVGSLPSSDSASDVGVGGAMWVTPPTEKLSDKDVDDLRQGRRILYALGRSTFIDANGHHEKQSCSWLQPPGDAAIWHVCQGHNWTR